MLVLLSSIPVSSPSRCAVQDGKQRSSALLQHQLLEEEWGVAQAGQENKLEKSPPVCTWTVGTRVHAGKI